MGHSFKIRTGSHRAFKRLAQNAVKTAVPFSSLNFAILEQGTAILGLGIFQNSYSQNMA